MKTLFQGEAIYLRSNYASSKHTATITLQVGDTPSSLEPFTGHENKRYMIALVEIGNDEQPTSTPSFKKERDRLGALCEWAVMRCKDPSFWAFLNNDPFFDGNDYIDCEEVAKETILFLCAIGSRKELDTDQRAKDWFTKNIMKRWQEWLRYIERAGKHEGERVEECA